MSLSGLISTTAILMSIQAAELPPEVRPTPDLDAPVWSYGLTSEFVPATSQPPAQVRPQTPVETWWWQFFAAETETRDTLATRVRIDCTAHTYEFLSHTGIKDGRLTGSEPALIEPPVVVIAGSVLAGLVAHVCEPAPEHPVRRYTNYFTARETLDEYFATR